MQAIVLLLGMIQWSLSYKLPRRNLLKSKFSSVVLFDSILNMETNIKVTRGIFAHILLESNLTYEDGEWNNKLNKDIVICMEVEEKKKWLPMLGNETSLWR